MVFKNVGLVRQASIFGPSAPQGVPCKTFGIFLFIGLSRIVDYLDLNTERHILKKNYTGLIKCYS